MKPAVKLRLSIVAKDDTALRILLADILDAMTSNALRRGYSITEKHGVVSATIERHDNVPWGFEEV